MKTINTRRFLIPATLLVALGLTGISVASPNDVNNPQPPGMATMRKGRLGISVLPMSEALRAKLGAARDRGVLVDTMRPDSTAAQAGLRVGDVVTAVHGRAVQSAGDIIGAIADRKRGEGVVLSVVRDGRPLDITATLADDPAPRSMMGGGDFEMPGPRSRTWRWLRELDGSDVHSATVQRELDETRKRLDDLELRLEKLEQH